MRPDNYLPTAAEQARADPHACVRGNITARGHVSQHENDRAGHTIARCKKTRQTIQTKIAVPERANHTRSRIILNRESRGLLTTHIFPPPLLAHQPAPSRGLRFGPHAHTQWVARRTHGCERIASPALASAGRVRPTPPGPTRAYWSGPVWQTRVFCYPRPLSVPSRSAGLRRRGHPLAPTPPKPQQRLGCGRPLGVCQSVGGTPRPDLLGICAGGHPTISDPGA